MFLSRHFFPRFLNRYGLPLIAASLLALPLLTQAEPENHTVGRPSFLSPHTQPIVVCDPFVYVVNTPDDTVDVIDIASKEVVERIAVGVDPVSLAVRPDETELWVANHISDSVSVIDLQSHSPTFQRVIHTIQEFDEETRATAFDEPMGIAFANDDKAYVALSSANEIAVINTHSREILKRLRIPAQDPRAIRVRGDRLYVIPFESNNQTQLSGGNEIDGDLVTFNAYEHSIRVNNVLSLGHKTDIVKHPQVPDRDLFVFDTNNDRRVATVRSLGTLLYGLAIDSTGTVFIAQTDARNDVNGRAGTQGHGLDELENRAFLNRITRVDFDGDQATETQFIELEPLPPEHPERHAALATPFAVEVSPDDRVLFATAAGSDQFFSIDSQTGAILGKTTVDAVPRGIALQASARGTAQFAWVLNAVANTVSAIDVSDPTKLRVRSTIDLEDPTHPEFKRGRIAFNAAEASSTATFSCASCHPDGHTDQLLWVLKTPVVTGGDQIMPRSTMPIRGLRETEPYHWDGIPGDPYGGINSASIRKSVEPNSDASDPTTSSRHLIDGGLGSTMLAPGDTTVNDEGKAGRLSKSQRDAMAKFLLDVPYPPAQKRAFDNTLSPRAQEGFELFHIIGDKDGTPGSNLCGNCHRMPFWTSTNTPGTGMDAPTWRGAYDRFLILPQGRLNIIGFDFYRRIAERGNDERSIWRLSWGGREAFDPVWNMVLEGSTGYSGSFARSLTLNQQTAHSSSATQLLDALEISASESAIVLTVEGVMIRGERSRDLSLRYQTREGNHLYVSTTDPEKFYTREQLTQLAAKGRFVGSFIARQGAASDYDHPQPALWTEGPIERQRGPQDFPVLSASQKNMVVSGRHIASGAQVIVDGRRVDGEVRLLENERVSIALQELPEPGLRFLQLQNPGGRFSNDFLFHVLDPESERRLEIQAQLNAAIAGGKTDAVRSLLAEGADPNGQDSDESRPLNAAAVRGHSEMVALLLDAGADPSSTNNDGNTALHAAAFFIHKDVVDQLLQAGASVDRKNRSGDTPIDVVSGEWSEGLGDFYRGVGRSIGLDIDLPLIREARPKMAARLRSAPKDDS